MPETVKETNYNKGIKRVWPVILIGGFVGFLAYSWILGRAFDHYERTLMEASIEATFDTAQREAAVRSFAQEMLERRSDGASQSGSEPTPETLEALEPYFPQDGKGTTSTLTNISRYFRARASSTGQTIGNGPCSETNLDDSFEVITGPQDGSRNVETCISGLIARYLSAAETAEEFPANLRAAQSSPLTYSQFRRAWIDFAIFGAPKRDEAIIISALHAHFKIPPSAQLHAILAEALAQANESPAVERARLGVDLFRGLWQCLLLGILFGILGVIAIVRRSSQVLPGARRRLAWLLDSATAFGLAGTVHGLILALFEIKRAMSDGSSVAFAGVMGGMALAFSTTLIGVAIERFGQFAANGHEEVPQ